jgi:hypothetical protein
VSASVSFFNYCNNGDIAVSRDLVKYTMRVAREKLGAECKFRYYHKNSPRLTVDIPELEYHSLTDMPKVSGISDLRSFKYKDTIFLNTWYASSPIFKGMFCTLNTLHELFRANLKEWFEHDIDMDVGKFLPTYDVQRLDAQLNFATTEVHRIRVLLCNGQPMSGQTNMPAGALEEAIGPLIEKYSDALFIITNPAVDESRPDSFEKFGVHHNVRYVDRIIVGVDGCDLPEVAYLSGYCDVIIGRGSGPYSFSLIRENLTDSNKTFVCFTDDERVARWVYMSDVVKAKIVWSRDYSVESMRAIVDKVLEEKTRG